MNTWHIYCTTSLAQIADKGNAAMRTALVIALMALALQPGGLPSGAGKKNASGLLSPSAVAQPRFTSGEFCERVAPGNLTAQTAVLKDEVQLVLQGDHGTTAADF